MSENRDCHSENNTKSDNCSLKKHTQFLVGSVKINNNNLKNSNKKFSISSILGLDTTDKDTDTDKDDDDDREDHGMASIIFCNQQYHRRPLFNLEHNIFQT